MFSQDSILVFILLGFKGWFGEGKKVTILAFGRNHLLEYFPFQGR